MALPGAKEALTPEYVFEMMDLYRDVGQDELRRNLINFLEAVVPAARQAGIALAIHPDDPPFPVLGLPRVVSTAKDCDHILNAVPDNANGLCFCTGSLGSRVDNNVIQMFDKWSERVHFLHLRNTTCSVDGSFVEARHLGGDTDMYVLMRHIVKAMRDQQRSIPMRPDHGFRMSCERDIVTYPGYTYAGRAKGLAELRGLEHAIYKAVGN
jgi:mannonate dehydratase